MYLHKSEKARRELSSRQRVLNLRERGALFLADGRKTQDEMQALLQDDGSILKKLIADGYLICSPESDVRALHPNTEAAAPAQPAPPAAVEPPKSSSDNFGGKRSLATTRMFLFDICERMFTKTSPTLARHYCDQLREARDRESMMAIARNIIVNVEEVAGSERADGLSERIAMMLPPEQ
jgi:hypothetical protein